MSRMPWPPCLNCMPSRAACCPKALKFPPAAKSSGPNRWWRSREIPRGRGQAHYVGLPRNSPHRRRLSSNGAESSERSIECCSRLGRLRPEAGHCLCRSEAARSELGSIHNCVEVESFPDDPHRDRTQLHRLDPPLSSTRPKFTHTVLADGEGEHGRMHNRPRNIVLLNPAAIRHRLHKLPHHRIRRLADPRLP